MRRNSNTCPAMGRACDHQTTAVQPQASRDLSEYQPVPDGVGDEALLQTRLLALECVVEQHGFDASSLSASHDLIVKLVEQPRDGGEDGGSQSQQVLRQLQSVALVKPHAPAAVEAR